VRDLVTQSGYALDQVGGQLHDVAVHAADAVGDDVAAEVERFGHEAAKKVRWEIEATRKAVETRAKVVTAERRTGRGKGGYRGVGCRRCRTKNSPIRYILQILAKQRVHYVPMCTTRPCTVDLLCDAAQQSNHPCSSCPHYPQS
jgi:hypothetical protein